MSKVFFITGTSTGFGHHYAAKALAEGHKVVATARDSSKLSIEGSNDSNFLAVSLDVTKPEQIDAAFKNAVAKFGRLDVVCNNAGYGLCGPFETLSDEQIRFQMEVNFFGLLNVTRKALEVMRDTNKPSGGLIQQVTSIGGQRGVPTFSVYCASKWAVEGATEAMAQELDPKWGCALQLIEPGGFVTEWAGSNMHYGTQKLDVYKHIDAKGNMQKRQGTQVGDPVKGGQRMYDLAVMDNPPLRVVLGSDAHAAMETKLKTYGEERKTWEHISLSTDRDDKK